MNILLSALRGAIQTWWGLAVTWLAAHAGIVITEDQSAVVVGVLMSVVVGLAIAAIRWMESLEGDEAWKRLLRLVAKLLMLGLSQRQPVYPGNVVESQSRPERRADL